MEQDWQPARAARALDLRSSPEGHAIVQYASHGAVLARCIGVTGVSWPKDGDGWSRVPEEFWKAILTLTGSKYRNWDSGIFKFQRAVGAHGYSGPVDVIGVEFDLVPIRKLLGAPSATATPASPNTDHSTASIEPVKRARGRQPGDGEIDDVEALALMKSVYDRRVARGEQPSANSLAQMAIDVLGLASANETYASSGGF